MAWEVDTEKNQGHKCLYCLENGLESDAFNADEFGDWLCNMHWDEYLNELMNGE